MNLNIEKCENGYVVTYGLYGSLGTHKSVFKDFQELVEFVAHHFSYLKIGEEFEKFKVMM